MKCLRKLYLKYLTGVNISYCIIKGGAISPDPFDFAGLSDNLPASTGAVKKTPQSFLGENSALVNLDNLVSASAIKPAAPAPAGEFLKKSHFLQYPK